MPCYCAKEVPKLQPVWLLSYECYCPDDTHAGSQWSKALQLTHSGKKPFVCDQHVYSSTQAQALKRHKLTHSGGRPYACNHSNYSSTTAQPFKTHKIIHNDESPFACDQCYYSSRQAPNINT